jgi:hypothetical protein
MAMLVILGLAWTPRSSALMVPHTVPPPGPGHHRCCPRMRLHVPAELQTSLTPCGVGHRCCMSSDRLPALPVNSEDTKPRGNLQAHCTFWTRATANLGGVTLDTPGHLSGSPPDLSVILRI